MGNNNKLVLLTILIITLVFMSTTIAAAELDIKILRADDPDDDQSRTWSAFQGGRTQLIVDVKNLDYGKSVTKKLECGIYDTKVIQSWYGDIVTIFAWILPGQNNVPNCVPGEKFVGTKIITWKEGATNKVFFSLIAPTNMNLDYLVHCSDYDKCWADQQFCNGVPCPGESTGQTDFDIHSFRLLDKPNIPDNPLPSCSDNSINQDESDINCGGRVCPRCSNGFSCNINSDCLSGVCGTNNRCTVSSDDGQDDPSTPPDDDDIIVPPKTSSEWLYKPTIVNRRVYELGDPVTVRGVFKAATEADYVLEAGTGKISNLFGITTIARNTCDPDEPWFANQAVHLTSGEHTIEFTVTPKGEGYHNFWVAQVRACGGTVLHQLKGEGDIQVGVFTLPRPVNVLTIILIVGGGLIFVLFIVLILFLLNRR